MSNSTAVGIVFVGVLLLSWVVNFAKLTQCDFESKYKSEVTHAIGLVPLFSVVTVWFGTDSESK